MLRELNIAALALAITGGGFSTAASAAALVPTTVTASGPFGNSLSVINDGVFPPDYTPYNAPSSVYYGSNAFTNGNATTFTFNFGGLFLINQIQGAVDFNDDYTFTFLNGATTTGAFTHFAGSGPVNFGLQNFTSSVTPTLATAVRLSTANGDSLYGVGEVEFSGTPNLVAAVPEPASWAMLITGFGLIGAGVRYRRRRTVLRYA